MVELAARLVGFKTVYRDHNLRPCPEVLAQHRLAPGIYSSIKADEFDVVWFDLAIPPEVVSKLKKYQKVS